MLGICCVVRLALDAPGPHEFDNLFEDGAVVNQQQHTIRVAVATGKSSHQVWWSRYQEDILACTDRLFGVGGEYTVLLHDEILGGPQPLPDNLVECLTSRWVASLGPAPSGQPASKQSSWDRPGLLVDSAAVEESCFSGLFASQHEHHTVSTGFWYCPSVCLWITA